MRQVATWIVAVALAMALVGCGHDRAADGTPESAERAVRAILDALATGDAKPLCEAQDLREHYAALPASARATTSFETFAGEFGAACAWRAAAVYRVGASAHQVVGHYEDAGRTVVKVRFRPDTAAAWVEWDLPCRHIDGTWRMGAEAAAAIFGDRPEPLSASPPAEPPAPAPSRPPSAVDEAEQKALAELRLFLAQGGDVNEIVDESTLLREPAMDVTRLHVAAERGWSVVAAFLVEQGANVRALASTKSHYNDVTPIDVARHAGHADLVAVLERSYVSHPVSTALASTTLALEFPDPRNAAALVSFDADRIRVLTEDMFGQEVADDLFVEPSDPEVLALTGRFGALKHVGSDVAVASIETSFAALQALPTEPVAWRIQLHPDVIRSGTVFLVRSGLGRVYKVQIEQCDRSRLALRYALLPAAPSVGRTLGAPTDRSAAVDRQRVRDVARAFVRASQKGDAQAAAALCTGDVARDLLAASSDGEHRPAITEYDVREVEATGAQATADVWVRNDAFPEGQDEYTLKLTLRRIGADWRIGGVSLEPHWKPEDLGPEVDR